MKKLNSFLDRMEGSRPILLTLCPPGILMIILSIICRVSPEFVMYTHAINTKENFDLMLFGGIGMVAFTCICVACICFAKGSKYFK